MSQGTASQRTGGWEPQCPYLDCTAAEIHNNNQLGAAWQTNWKMQITLTYHVDKTTTNRAEWGILSSPAPAAVQWVETLIRTLRTQWEGGSSKAQCMDKEDVNHVKQRPCHTGLQPLPSRNQTEMKEWGAPTWIYRRAWSCPDIGMPVSPAKHHAVAGQGRTWVQWIL